MAATTTMLPEDGGKLQNPRERRRTNGDIDSDATIGDRAGA